MRRSVFGLLTLLLCVWLVAGPATNAQNPRKPFATTLDQWTRSLDSIGQELDGPRLAEARVNDVHQTLDAIEKEAREIKSAASAAVQPVKAQLESLGPAPQEGEPEEDPQVARQRKKLQEDIASYEGRVKQADLTLARTLELREKIATQQLEQSIEAMFETYPLPLAPSTLAVAGPDLVEAVSTIARAPADWWSSLSPAQRGQTPILRLAVVILIAIIVAWVLRRAVLRWFGRNPAIQEPTYTRRLIGAIAEAFAYGIVPATILGAFYYRATSGEGIITGTFAQLVATFCAVMIMFILAWALTRAVLAPNVPQWRLVSVSASNARRITRRITSLAAIFAIDIFFVMSVREMNVSAELVSVYTFVVKTLEAIVIFSLLDSALWHLEEEKRPDTAPADAPAGEGAADEAAAPGFWTFWTTLRRAVGLIAVAAIGAALLGYANFSSYLAESLVFSGMAIAILFIIRSFGREIIGMALRSSLMQKQLGLPHKVRSRYKFWLRAILDIAIYLAGALAVLVTWGVPAPAIFDWSARVLQAFKVGNVTISLTDILIGILIFIVALFITRATQRVLTDRVFPEIELDPGVRNSLSAGVGYIGIAIAAALAISAVGLDLSNIALIAGALSVGIGFGLQNVVNNFVSGLILLIERPIKVGDWIVVGAHEGFVKRINVRATEIETFQRASVIVPNSELVSGSVTNWTHKDRYGRVEVPVGVAYGSDVEKVMTVIKKCFAEHEEILAWPEPFVLFRGFGDSSLDFEGRGYIGNVALRVLVGSDLCVAIDRAFREANIEIPFPQRDLHVRTAPGLEAFLAGRASASQGDGGNEGHDEKARAAPAGPPAPGPRREQSAPLETELADGDSDE